MLKMIQSKQTMIQINKYLKVFLMFFYFSSCKFAEKTDYIFPNNYKGWAIVIYDFKNGKQCEEIGGRVQVEIPQNGILFTSTKRPEGILDNKYFSKNIDGSYSKIYPSINSISKSDTTSLYVLVESYQSIKINESYYSNKSTINSNDNWINYDELVIFKIASGISDTIVNKMAFDEYLESIKKQLIEKVTQ